MSQTRSSRKKFFPLPLLKKSLPFILAIILLVLIFATYELSFQNRFFPGIFIGDSAVSFMDKTQAYRVIWAKFGKRAADTIHFSYTDHDFTIDLTKISTNINYSKSLDSAFAIGHSADLAHNLLSQSQALFFKSTTSPDIDITPETQIQQIASVVNKDPVDATLFLDELKKIHTTDGTNGIALDTKQLSDQIKNYLAYGSYTRQVPVKIVEPNLTTTEAQNAKEALEKVQNEPIELTYKDHNRSFAWTIDVPTLYHLLNLIDGGSLIDARKLTDFVKSLADTIDQPVQEPLFNFDPATKRVTAFRPSQEGLSLDQAQTQSLTLTSINNQGPKSITLPVSTVSPIVQTAAVNMLGIKELIGRGISNFALSIPNRIFNITLTAARLNGVLIPPGGVFSFNNIIGDISAATGFRQAYVIKEGRTVLDDGGGVCQDSTTLFRAVLNAGLPVLKRTAHAYRVGYYEQGFPPGLDATVFYPSVDFQFKNDTPASILIQAYTYGTTLYVDLYGTSDGREVALTKPVVTNQTPPPPELKQDDPTLPKGTLKQVDFPAWGANVSFKRTVTKNGEVVINETWRSNYKPWQAIFLVGTQ